MNQRVRTLLYLFFLCLFLVTAPAVVLYTAGYRLRLDRFDVVRTGLLSVSTLPKEAVVTMDGRAFEETTPAVFSDIPPGDHVVRIQKEGYLPWEKVLPVLKNTTTFVHGLVLFSQREAVLRLPGTVTDAVLDPTGRHIAYATTEEAWVEIWSRNTTEGEPVLLLRFPAAQYRDVGLFWSAGGTYLLVQGNASDAPPRLMVSNTDGRFRLDVNQLLSSAVLKSGVSEKKVTQAFFDNQLDDQLYVQTTDRLLSLAMPDASVTTFIDRPVVATHTGSDIVTVGEVEGRMTVWRQSEDGSRQRILAYVPYGDYVILPSPNAFVLLMDRTSRRILLLEANGTDRPILLHASAEWASWNPAGGNELLYGGDFEIHVYRTEDHTDELLTRLSRPVPTAVWHPHGTAVIFTDGQEISAVELDRRGGGRNVTPLTNLDHVSHLWIDPRGRTLSFVGARGDEEGIFERKLQRR
ncbi:PEGA domain-containing protein [Candidatus Uhrbacteria bacterium]|nr:PEGA domain-containing protein [Candidatus Uhrbacteria bacterium]